MTSLVRVGAVMEAYASWSRWVADCGHCQYGASRLQPNQPHFLCRFCGGITEVIWPNRDMIIGVERLLMMRPDPSTRNWLPGETLVDLTYENGIHGIFDNLHDKGITGKPGEMILAVDEGRIRVDQLPMIKPRVRREIT